jgi:hypothetical protein
MRRRARRVSIAHSTQQPAGVSRVVEYRCLPVLLRIPMRRKIYLLALELLLIGCLVKAQSKPESKPTVTVLKAGRALDVRTGRYLKGAGVLIEGDRIKEVGAAADIQARAPKSAAVIDLGRATVLPGLVTATRT